MNNNLILKYKYSNKVSIQIRVSVSFRLLRLVVRRVLGFGKMLKICIIRAWNIIRVKSILRETLLRIVVRTCCLWASMSPCSLSLKVHQVTTRLARHHRSDLLVCHHSSIQPLINMVKTCLSICPCNSHLINNQFLSILLTSNFKIHINLKLKSGSKGKGSRY